MRGPFGERIVSCPPRWSRFGTLKRGAFVRTCGNGERWDGQAELLHRSRSKVARTSTGWERWLVALENGKRVYRWVHARYLVQGGGK